jgi:uncharacterized protein
MSWELLWGHLDHNTPIDVHELELPLANLAQGLEGTRLAVMSDLHYGRFARDGYAARLVAELMAVRPDVICLLGDLVNGQASECAPCARVLSGLSAPLGVYAVIGNHEHYGGWRTAVEAYRHIGLRVLLNEHTLLCRDDACLVLAGVDDFRNGRPDVPAALKNAPEGLPAILLSHNPDLAEYLPDEPRIDVILSGHTHGGQVVPFGRPIITRNRHKQYWRGWAQGPRCPVYTNRGVGVTGLPLRLNCRPEIPIFRLVRKRGV